MYAYLRDTGLRPYRNYKVLKHVLLNLGNQVV